MSKERLPHRREWIFDYPQGKHLLLFQHRCRQLGLEEAILEITTSPDVAMVLPISTVHLLARETGALLHTCVTHALTSATKRIDHILRVNSQVFIFEDTEHVLGSMLGWVNLDVCSMRDYVFDNDNVIALDDKQLDDITRASSQYRLNVRAMELQAISQSDDSLHPDYYWSTNTWFVSLIIIPEQESRLHEIQIYLNRNIIP